MEWAKGESGAKSLLEPQGLAKRLLPADEYERLMRFALRGVPAECGPPWPAAVIERAKEVGPHVSALTDDGVELIWSDIQYQVDAGFVKILSEAELFGPTQPEELKISRVAVVPQDDRRDRIILNLSAEVELEQSRRKTTQVHPSVNATTAAAEDQTAVKKLGLAMRSLLLFMFETNCAWEIEWQKVDLSDGFWRMIVEAGKEYNFVFQMPQRPGDSVRYYVVPSALQMGWTNSPPYFCTATEATKLLILRVLASTLKCGISVPHRHEAQCVAEPPASPVQPAPADISVVLQVFVDDFMNGLAGDPRRPSKRQEQLWLSRATLHSIHGVFPPPEVTGHHGGKDSISQKKLNKGDAQFATGKEMLGAWLDGQRASGRCVGLTDAKARKFESAVQKILASPAHRVSLREFQQVLGKLQYTSQVMPSMRGFFTPLNRAMVGKRPRDCVGLGKKSEVRGVLTELVGLVWESVHNPSHITELVPPHLPHFYCTVDASGVGLGGVILPCTRWIHPVVWRVALPPDISRGVDLGTTTMVDCEFAAFFIGNCLLHDLLIQAGERVEGMNSHTLSDNSPSVGITGRQATRAESPMPARTLRWSSRRQRHYRSGPQTLEHWPGEKNGMADFPSRSFAQGFADSDDAGFLNEFSRRYPLPSQLKSWRVVRPRTELCSAAFSLLRKVPVDYIEPTDLSGDGGVPLPKLLAKTLTCGPPRRPPDTWNEATCSWPLLLPCGTVCSVAESPFPGRQSREHFACADSSWNSEALLTLGAQIQEIQDSTAVWGSS